jgi:antirestriction protein ArdC
MKYTDKAKELVDKLHAGIEQLVTGDDWKAALAFQARFHRYSFYNTLLIAFQRPDATFVGGMKNVWNKMGRHVRKGEHGIAILAPMTYKKTDPDTGEVRSGLSGFRTVFVFDVSQTEGAPIPESVAPEELDGDAPTELYDRLSTFVRDRGFVVEDADEDRLHSAKGMTVPAKWSKDALGLILVKRSASALQRTKTLVHEVAHAMLHVDNGYDYRGHRGIAETEAESVAFVVCAALGLPTDDYSFAYVGGWSNGDMELVRKTGERVAKTAKTILEGVEK